MAIMMLLDNYTAHELSAMLPHRNVISTDAPRQLGSIISPPKPFIATLARWFENGRK
jgi:hypothetical protein